MLGYYPKASISWLVVKEEFYEISKQLFDGTGVSITTEGRKYLGGVIGTKNFAEIYVSKLVIGWLKQIQVLAVIAKSEPQYALAAFLRGLQHKFTYHLRSIPGMENYVKLSGIGIPIMTETTAVDEYKYSKMLTNALSTKVYNQDKNIGGISEDVKTVRINIKA